MELGVNWLRVYAEGKNALFEKHVPPDRAGEFGDLRSTPVVDEKPDYNWSTIPHLDDFFENVKSRGRCKAPVEECFKAMVAVAMAIRSYQSCSTVRWDRQQEKMI
jgi:hypothetical protein